MNIKIHVEKDYNLPKCIISHMISFWTMSPDELAILWMHLFILNIFNNWMYVWINLILSLKKKMSENCLESFEVIFSKTFYTATNLIHSLYWQLFEETIIIFFIQCILKMCFWVTTTMIKWAKYGEGKKIITTWHYQCTNKFCE